MACLFCGKSRVAEAMEVSEMMLGYGDAFTYLKCGCCGSLQIESPPENLSKYYPGDYYSFESVSAGGLRSRLRRARAVFAIHQKGISGRLLCRIFGAPAYATWLRHTGAAPESSILDVGSGSGALLSELREAGFVNLLGIDPFLRKDAEVNGVRLLKGDLKDVEGRFDLIMCHHSMEHMPDPLETLQQIHKRLNEGGRAVIRLPIAGSWACEHYGRHWVQLDAPRHLAIPSVEGMKCLAARAGFEIRHTFFDSHELQFIGSELYQRGIPLRKKRRSRYFSRSELRAFKRKSEQLNAEGKGDAGCFIMAKADSADRSLAMTI
jgi:SAM-dependent methyltransferase